MSKVSLHRESDASHESKIADITEISELNDELSNKAEELFYQIQPLYRLKETQRIYYSVKGIASEQIHKGEELVLRRPSGSCFELAHFIVVSITNNPTTAGVIHFNAWICVL